jgi:hypothetical protein
VAGRIPEHPERVVDLVSDARDPGGAKGKRLLLGLVGVLDPDVEVELLGRVRVGEARRFVLR